MDEARTLQSAPPWPIRLHKAADLVKEAAQLVRATNNSTLRAKLLRKSALLLSQAQALAKKRRIEAQTPAQDDGNA